MDNRELLQEMGNRNPHKGCQTKPWFTKFSHERFQWNNSSFLCLYSQFFISWLRYSRGLKLTIGQMVHTVFHELILKAVEEVHHYSLSQDIKSINWLPISA